MKTYDVTVRFRGEGYATRTIRVQAMNPAQAKSRAVAWYMMRIEVDEPVEIRGLEVE